MRKGAWPSTWRMDSRPQIICLTPVLNEAWILEKFLACASLWADRIVVADGGSSDESLEIASRCERAIVVHNRAGGIDEEARQRLLIDTAREIPGPKILVALDADEFLTADFERSPEWQTILTAPPGTLFQFRSINLLPGFQRAWIADGSAAAYVDDGREHVGRHIHGPRLPRPPNERRIRLNDIGVLHYQYVDWPRMESKHVWYQCYECLRYPEKRTVELFRKYHHMYCFRHRPKLTIPVESRWFERYERAGVAMREMRSMVPWWDEAVVEMMMEQGARALARAAIWGRDWAACAAPHHAGREAELRDPRTMRERALHAYLHATQDWPDRAPVKLIDYTLRALGA